MDFLKQIFDVILEGLKFLQSGSVAFNEVPERTAALEEFNTVTGAASDLLGMVRK